MIEFDIIDLGSTVSGGISPRGQRRGGRLPAMLDIDSLVQTQLLLQV